MAASSSTHEISAPTSVIAGGIAGWIKKINEPFTEPERATYEYRLFIDDLKLPYDNPTNEIATRATAQHKQLALWTADFLDRYEELEGEEKDRMLGRQTFCAQTYIAQLSRMQNMLQATGEAEYLARLPESSVAGIDIIATVDETLRKVLAAGGVSKQKLVEGTTTLINRHDTHIKDLYPTAHLDTGDSSSGTIVDNLDLQAWWTGLVVEYVAFGANERGGELAAVPSLDPASTESEPIVYYPFAAA